MMNPKFENITQMDISAINEDDGTCNMRLKRREMEADRPARQAKVWLRVFWTKADGFIYSLDARKNTTISRALAQQLIDDEWGR